MNQVKSKYRYRSPNRASHCMMAFVNKNLAKIGAIKSITGVRWSAWINVTVDGVETKRRSNGSEAILIRGENGTARFTGVCWGYGGEGPHTLRDILLHAGVPQAMADAIAFKSTRFDRDGWDWRIDFTEFGPVSSAQIC